MSVLSVSINDYIVTLEEKYHFLWEPLLKKLRKAKEFTVINVDEEQKILKFKKEDFCLKFAVSIPVPDLPGSFFFLWLDNEIIVEGYNLYHYAYVDSVRRVLYHLQKLPRITDIIKTEEYPNTKVKQEYDFTAQNFGNSLRMNIDLEGDPEDFHHVVSIKPLDPSKIGLCPSMNWFDELVTKTKWEECVDDDAKEGNQIIGNISAYNWLGLLNLAQIWNTKELKCVWVVLGYEMAVEICVSRHKYEFNRDIFEIYINRFLTKLGLR
jgi:hypothetical protein